MVSNVPVAFYLLDRDGKSEQAQLCRIQKFREEFVPELSVNIYLVHSLFLSLSVVCLISYLSVARPPVSHVVWFCLRGRNDLCFIYYSISVNSLFEVLVTGFSSRLISSYVFFRSSAMLGLCLFFTRSNVVMRSEHSHTGPDNWN